MVILGLAALVIDLGHARVVKRELQKAAEAGALTGARALALDPTQANGLATALNWSYGRTRATTAVQQNYANGALLDNFNTDGDLTKVQAGYWDIRWTMATAPANLNGYLDPAGYAADTAYEIPAVKVLITQTQSGSGGTGPMPTYFASVVGVGSMTMQGSAVAMLPSITETLNTVTGCLYAMTARVSSAGSESFSCGRKLLTKARTRSWCSALVAIL